MRKYYAVLRYFKKTLNVPQKVSVRRTKMPKDYDGDCILKDDIFYVRIDKNIPQWYAIDVLIHELAHVLAWGKDLTDVHGACWGKAYSKVYRLFLEFDANVWKGDDNV